MPAQQAHAAASAGGGGAAVPGGGSDAAATSRLCVKNLPKYVNEQRLKEHFAAKGIVTDVKLLKTRDGHSRQMAFVGYRSVEDAAAALKYFSNTFLDTSRLSIEYARRYRAPMAAAAAAAAAADGPSAGGGGAAAAAAAGEPRPWSKYSVGSSKHQALLAKQQAAAAAGAGDDKGSSGKEGAKAKKRKAKGQAVDDPSAADPKLAEFLQLMQPRSKAKIWSNDELLPGSTAAAAAAGTGAAAADAGAMAAADGEDEEADELYVDLPGADAFGGRRQARAPASDDGESDDDDDDDEDDADPLASKDAVVVDEGVSDLDYLRARMRPGLAGGTGGTDGSAPASGSDDGDGDDGSGSSGGEEDEEELQQQRRRRRQGSGSSGSSSGSEGEEGEQDGSGSEGGSDGDVQQLGDADGSDGDGDGAQFDASARGDQAGAGPSGGAGACSTEAALLDTGRLFVRNLAYSASEADLRALFAEHGQLEEVHVVTDRDTQRSRGIAYIKFLLPQDAVAAWRSLDMAPFQGRLLHILPAARRPGEDAGGSSVDAGAGAEAGAGGAGASSFKAQRAAQRKGDAGNRAAWSSLFMRADTVAAAVAAHYGVSKSQLLDAGASDLPLRMALGEAQVIAQTKAALADDGINVAALEAAAAAAGAASASKCVARSSTSLLVKNLPYSADEDELRALLAGPAGRAVLRLVLPPTKTLALVEFGEPAEARSAFKSLAFKKYQQVPLYLEWAPADIWDTPAAAAPAAAAASKTAAAAASDSTAAAAAKGAGAAAGGAADAGASAAGAVPDEAEDSGAALACIYVKNVSFATSDASLRRHFDGAVAAAGGSIHSAKVARRKGPDGKLLSMGFGFVETDSVEVARAAIQALQGSLLDKYKVQLQLSKRPAPGSAAASKAAAAASKAAPKDAGAKLVVRNVAFEATRKDLLGLFGPFGHIKSCRLPKKFDGHHRGFAFLEFTTKQEASNALEGVSGTHLYGRRLVVEYAAADDEAAGLDELRAKTAAKYAAGEAAAADAGGAPAPKRMRKNL